MWKHICVFVTTNFIKIHTIRELHKGYDAYAKIYARCIRSEQENRPNASKECPSQCQRTPVSRCKWQSLCTPLCSRFFLPLQPKNVLFVFFLLPGGRRFPICPPFEDRADLGKGGGRGVGEPAKPISLPRGGFTTAKNMHWGRTRRWRRTSSDSRLACLAEFKNGWLVKIP